jgi:hypothetical protein
MAGESQSTLADIMVRNDSKYGIRIGARASILAWIRRAFIDIDVAVFAVVTLGALFNDDTFRGV